MSKTTKHIIETKNLSIGYTSKKQVTTIASNLNISLKKGNLVCLLGQNGIGKTTLLRTLTGVQPLLNGSISINQKELHKYNNLELAKNISLVLTEKLPINSLSVFELVSLGRQPYTNWIGYLTNRDLKIINTALQQTNTKHLANRKYYELSDGQLQKVLIARALAQDTNIIVLDEPTAHLDIHHTVKTFKLLKHLAKELNKTVIVSTHEVNLSLQLADCLWLMTPNSFSFGKTKDLIKKNKLNHLFDSNLVLFNQKLKQFELYKK